MHAKHCLVGFILLLLLTIGTNQVFSAATISPESPEHGRTVKWKSIPEDSSPWQREPFRSTEPLTRETGGKSAKQMATEASSEFALQGIMKRNKYYYAIINGRTVKAGDHIDGWRIADISRYRVTLLREKEKQIYDIYQGRIDRGTR